jgi:hypothetical protein
VATTTTKLALTKPDGTDLVDIAVLNANADKIDTASGAFICTSTTRPASPWNGQLIFETDTLNALVYRTSSTSWNIVGGSTVSADPPANAGSGNFWWDSDNGKLYIYYNDGNTSQWVSANSNTSGVPIVGNEAGRDSLYPTPAQGNSVFRNDLGVEETYYGLYNASTNPGGRDTAGWYVEDRRTGLVPIQPASSVIASGSGSANALGVVSFSNATAVSLNGIFSDTPTGFLSYRIILRITTATTLSTQLSFRLRNAGVDNSTTNYAYAGLQIAVGGTAGAATLASATNHRIGNLLTEGNSSIIELHFPAAAIRTTFHTAHLGWNGAVTSIWNNGLFSTTDQFDGITFFPGGGTITGQVQVFGYND